MAGQRTGFQRGVGVRVRCRTGASHWGWGACKTKPRDTLVAKSLSFSPGEGKEGQENEASDPRSTTLKEGLGWQYPSQTKQRTSSALSASLLQVCFTLGSNAQAKQVSRTRWDDWQITGITRKEGSMGLPHLYRETIELVKKEAGATTEWREGTAVLTGPDQLVNAGTPTVVKGPERGWRKKEGGERGRDDVCLLVGCLTSQQHASVSQGRICSDKFTCCHTEREVADPTFYLTLSQYTDTGRTSPSADPITPGAWVATGVLIFESRVWRDPEKIPAQAGFEPWIFRSRGGRLTTRPTRRLSRRETT